MWRRERKCEVWGHAGVSFFYIMTHVALRYLSMDGFELDLSELL